MEYDVKFGSIQNPYQEFVYTIPPLTEIKIDYAHNYFRVLSLSADVDALKVRFGGSGQTSTFTGAGLAYRIPDVIGFVTLRNEGATTMQIRVGLAIGEISDDRLNFVGNVPVMNAAGTSLLTKDVSGATAYVGQLTVPAATTTVAFSALAGSKYKMLKAGDVDLYWGYTNTVTNTTGFKLDAGQTIIIPNTLGIWVYSVTAQTAFISEEIY